MADRTITTRLTLDPSQYESGMQRAKKATEGLGESSKKSEKATTSAMQRMAQSARENRAEWQQVGGTLAAAGAATTGLMGAVLATGISYNQLRQSSLAALTTLTGSAENAVAQMDKLDAFASNSPFARDVFIRAQQQMLGFGIEAQKVIPYLDAIQNAVAAAGGSNHDIAELSRIFAQISASAKITATDLREFGNRGVDAATIIGSQMGKTGAEIRDQITDGSLDAGQALDALAAGMSETFEGASAGVKQTFAGAVDRVKAAFRDLSSIVAEPLVGREGGGLFTALLNQVADFMRAVQQLPAPVLQAGGALTTVGGLAATAAGGFMLLAPRLVETWDALGRMGTIGPRAQNALRGVAAPLGRIAGLGAAAGVTAVAVGALMSAITRPGVARSAENVASAIQQLVDSGEQLADLRLDLFMSDLATLDLGFFEVAKTQAQDLTDVLEKVADPSVTDRMSKFFAAFIPGVTSYMSDYEDALASFGAGLTHLATTDLPAAQGAFQNLANSMQVTTDQGAIELLDQLPGLRDALTGVATDAGLATDDTTLLGLAMGWIVPEAQAAAGAMRDYQGSLAGVQSGQKEANERLQEWRDMVAEAPSALGGLLSAYQSVIDKNKEVAEESAKATESSKDSWNDFYDGTAVSAADWIAALEEQAAAVAEFRENALTATEQIREQMPADMQAAADSMVDEMLRGGEEGAAALATFTEMSGEEKQRLIEAWLGTGAQIGDDFAYELENARQPEIGASTVPAETALAALLGAVANAEENVILNGHAVPAENVLSDLRHKIATAEEPVTINGDEAPANDVLDALMRAIANEEEDVTINGNRIPADQVVGELLAWIADQERDVDVGANTSQATNDVRNWAPPNKTIAMGADLTAARREVLSWRPSVQIAMTGQAAVATGAYMGDFPKFAGGGSPHYRPKGLLEGPGTTTSDSILARLSRKEFVVNAAATDYYSPAFMYALNARRIPKEALPGFRDGGAARHLTQVQYMPASRAPAPVLSLDGAHITGTLAFREDGLAQIIDGRIVQARRHEKAVNR